MKRKVAKSLAVILTIAMTQTSVLAAVPGELITPSVSVNDLFEIAPMQSSSYFTANGTTLTVNAVNGSDITTALQAALDEARDNASDSAVYTVVVPAGTYTLSSTLSIYSNTTLDMSAGVILNSAPSNLSMLMLGSSEDEHAYNRSAAVAGYGGYKNITVKGGSFIADPANTYTQMQLAHAANVTLQGVTVAGGTTQHMVEVVAIDGLMIDGCTFRDMAPTTEVSTHEALQLDLAVHDSIFGFVYQDGTMLKNVTVQNCTFSNVPRGIGSHSLLLNAYNENIKILNNTFKNIEQDCIVTLNYLDVEISGNTMTDCGVGVLVQSSKKSPTTIFTTTHNGTQTYTGTFVPNLKTVIKNNTIKTRYNKWNDSICGIKVFGRNITSPEYNETDHGTIPAGDYYISGVEISNNTITTAGYGIHLTNARDSVITGNSITGSGYDKKNDLIAKDGKYDGIHLVENSTGNKITGNTVTNAQSNGIFISGSSVTEISQNTISKAGKDSINLSEDAVSGPIASNKISDSKEHGIVVHGVGAASGDITGNTISVSGGSGIQASDNAKTGAITGNSISKSDVNGVCLTDNATAQSIASNTISTSKKTGIQITNKSKVTENIDGNTISDSTLNGIALLSATVNGDISNNNIKNSKKNGINLDGSTVDGNLLGNTVSKTTYNGIGVANKSTVGGNIEKNKVSDSKKTGIQVSVKSVVGNKILSNTVTGSTLHGIHVLTSSKVKGGIEKNNLKKNKKYGIFIASKANIGGSVQDNKIASGYIPVVAQKTATVNIRKNTFKKFKNAYSRIETTTINVKSIKKPAIASLKKKGTTLTVNCKKTSGAIGYYVEVSTTSDFNNIVKAVDSKTTTAKISKLKKGTTYYVRISAYKGYKKAHIHSDYSKTKKIKL